jgi:hypothetical protein
MYPSMKLRIFWDVLPCSQFNVDRSFRSTCCLHHIVFSWMSQRFH